MITYPQYTNELLKLLNADQTEVKAVGRIYWHGQKTTYNTARTQLKQHTRQRAARMLQILEEIGEPSISNIGSEAAQAVSILALHEGGAVLKLVLALFDQGYKRDKNDTYYKAIPSMTDWLLLSERKPQRFGTQWMFDSHQQPFLPTVEDFVQINERRAQYDIETLHWPKSLAIPEPEQPWLKRPLSGLVMRTPTDAEYEALDK
jgi:hypothetical protein